MLRRGRVSRTAVIVTLLFLVDLGVAGQGLISLLVAVVGGLVLTAGALAALRGENGAAVRSRSLRAGVYLLLGVATFATMRLHQATGQRHAAQVIEACLSYQARYGKLPDRLDELVPAFLPSVPPVRYTVQWAQFTYWASATNTHTLMYVAFPPFGRQLYHFEAARWTQLD